MTKLFIGPCCLAEFKTEKGGRWNYAWFCPHCGEVWARITYEEMTEGWGVLQRDCPKHPETSSQYRTSGSLFQDFNWNPFPIGYYLEKFPNLRKHEFAVTMAAAGAPIT